MEKQLLPMVHEHNDNRLGRRNQSQEVHLVPSRVEKNEHGSLI
jgi:hypothetical protein